MDLYESEATLVYELSSRTARATQKNSLEKAKQQQQQTSITEAESWKSGQSGQRPQMCTGFLSG